ncbi:MAG: twin-arginine translocase TatA/TatE family subunit [Actinobacteria bacterium]|nr:MAG: twin-arginine translocase TatA/TatE family subunit [Actinomycetota bacterium]
MNLGAPELIIILAVVLLLFGSTRLPKLARSLGQASKEFKHGANEATRDEPDALIVDETVSERQRTPKAGS